MNLNDDQLKIAAAIVARGEPSSRVKAALAALGDAPLRTIVNYLLEEPRDMRHGDVLRRIADLNEGRVEDLASSEFRSYLIRTLDVPEPVLEQCVRAIRLLANVQAAKQDDELTAAARSDADAQPRKSTIADLLRELKRSI